ncbi:prealbumin-like fold domain-containing protein [Weissella confusa]|uniref:Prealbumin-like fold domain-containing protein n=1 Tax=Weissella confusa TaxID=1583 RepID=A0A923NCQ3_WEICO|nr:prealbumin-like fold domain-containing protein [Weissella confusa]
MGSDNQITGKVSGEGENWASIKNYKKSVLPVVGGVGALSLLFIGAIAMIASYIKRKTDMRTTHLSGVDRGYFQYCGVADGQYVLHEEITPKGYKQMDDLKFTIGGPDSYYVSGAGANIAEFPLVTWDQVDEFLQKQAATLGKAVEENSQAYVWFTHLTSEPDESGNKQPIVDAMDSHMEMGDIYWVTDKRWGFQKTDSKGNPVSGAGFDLGRLVTKENIQNVISQLLGTKNNGNVVSQATKVHMADKMGFTGSDQSKVSSMVFKMNAQTNSAAQANVGQTNENIKEGVTPQTKMINNFVTFKYDNGYVSGSMYDQSQTNAVGWGAAHLIHMYGFNGQYSFDEKNQAVQFDATDADKKLLNGEMNIDFSQEFLESYSKLANFTSLTEKGVYSTTDGMHQVSTKYNSKNTREMGVSFKFYSPEAAKAFGYEGSFVDKPAEGQDDTAYRNSLSEQMNYIDLETNADLATYSKFGITDNIPYQVNINSWTLYGRFGYGGVTTIGEKNQGLVPLIQAVDPDGDSPDHYDKPDLDKDINVLMPAAVEDLTVKQEDGDKNPVYHNSNAAAYQNYDFQDNDTEFGVSRGKAFNYTMGVTFKDLVPGQTYYVLEIAAPSGYLPNGKLQKATLNPASEVTGDTTIGGDQDTTVDHKGGTYKLAIDGDDSTQNVAGARLALMQLDEAGVKGLSYAIDNGLLNQSLTDIEAGVEKYALSGSVKYDVIKDAKNIIEDVTTGSFPSDATETFATPMVLSLPMLNAQKEGKTDWFGTQSDSYLHLYPKNYWDKGDLTVVKEGSSAKFQQGNSDDKNQWAIEFVGAENFDATDLRNALNSVSDVEKVPFEATNDQGETTNDLHNGNWILYWGDGNLDKSTAFSNWTWEAGVTFTAYNMGKVISLDKTGKPEIKDTQVPGAPTGLTWDEILEPVVNA